MATTEPTAEPDAPPDSWTDPDVDSLDATITQGSFEADVTADVDASCMVDVERVFGPRLRVMLSGTDDDSNARFEIDVQLSDRDELVEMARLILDEYGDDGTEGGR